MGWEICVQKETQAVSLAYKHFNEEGIYIFVAGFVRGKMKSMLFHSEGTLTMQGSFEEIASQMKHWLNTNTLFTMYIRN